MALIDTGQSLLLKIPPQGSLACPARTALVFPKFAQDKGMAMARLRIAHGSPFVTALCVKLRKENPILATPMAMLRQIARQSGKHNYYGRDRVRTKLKAQSHLSGLHAV